MITLSMIVKNEAELLPGCLKSVKDFVDEIIIVDTGSTDDTVAIAESFGARVEHFEWVNDFGAAREYARSFIQTEWTLWLDADDLVENPHFIPKLLQTKNATGFWSIYKQDQTSQQRRLQLFKTKEYFWEGVVHEGLRPHHPEDSATRLSNLVVLHRKPKSRAAEAARSYLQILLEKDPENWFGIGESYRYLTFEDYSDEYAGNALGYYTKAMQHPGVNSPTKYICTVNLSKIALKLFEETKDRKWLIYAHKAAHTAVNLDQSRAEGWGLQAQCELYNGDKASAHESCDYALMCEEPQDTTGLYYYDYYYEQPKIIKKLLTDGLDQ